MHAYERPELRPAIEIIREASLLAQEVRQTMAVSAMRKDDRTPVTVADYAVQAVVARALGREGSPVPLVAEESGAALRKPESAELMKIVVDVVRRRVPDASSQTVMDWIDRGTSECGERFWTLDPIDGTKGFLRGDHYAIALALIERGNVIAGIIGCPTLDADPVRATKGTGCLAVAASGAGAWVAPLAGGAWRRLAVSSTTKPEDAVVLQSFEGQHMDTSQADRILQGLGVSRPSVRMDSLAKFVVLAAGSGDLLWRLPTPDRPDYKESIWDQAAGHVMVEEAGGKVSDIDGRPLDFSCGKKLRNNRGVLASNGTLHQRFLDAVKAG